MFPASFVHAAIKTHADTKLRRTPPLFHPHRWNMHEVPMADRPRNNNVCEGWNHKFHSLIVHSHPSIWKLIETLQAEAARITSTLLQSDRGSRQKKKTKRISTELHTRLRNLCKDTLQGRKSIAEFLRGVLHNIRGGQPHI